jgi:hypothetical protein
MAVTNVFERISDIPSVLQGIDNDFYKKNKKPNYYWQNE